MRYQLCYELVYSWKKTQTDAFLKAVAISNLKKNDFHKRLRREIVMIPIPKPSVINHKMVGLQNPENFINEVFEKQLHQLELALHRVSFCLTKSFTSQFYLVNETLGI